MSQVFLATEASLTRQVVVKVLQPEFTSEASWGDHRRAWHKSVIHAPNIPPRLSAAYTSTTQSLKQHLKSLESVMMNLTRRQALYIGLIPLALSVMPGIVARVLLVGDDFTREWAKSLDCFRALFADLGPPRDIGHRYLQSFPQERTRTFLTRAITEDEQVPDARQLRTLLAKKREHDFRNGNIAVVDGWVLSRTEARACALVALL